jgi:general secretion pathway protein J
MTARDPKTLRDESGFSLLEVMVAIAILGMISALVWYNIDQTFKTIDVVRADSDLLRQARQVTTRVPNELADAFFPVNLSSPASTVKFEFVADDHGELDKVRFQALSHTKFYRDSNESDQTELEYYTESDPRHPGLYRLMRREDPVLDDRPDEGGATLVVADKVKVFNLSYYDLNKDQWFDSWDTNRTDTANRLPYAVRLKLTLVDTDKKERTWVTATTIRMSKTQEQR